MRILKEVAFFYRNSFRLFPRRPKWVTVLRSFGPLARFLRAQRKDWKTPF